MPTIRAKAKSGRFIALLPENLIGGFAVVVTAMGVNSFNASWPCSAIPDDIPIRFEYGSNGDLVEVSSSCDGREMLALSEDAQTFGETCLENRRRKLS